MAPLLVVGLGMLMAFGGPADTTAVAAPPAMAVPADWALPAQPAVPVAPEALGTAPGPSVPLAAPGGERPGQARSPPARARAPPREGPRRLA
jgi:hypothetical protein